MRWNKSSVLVLSLLFAVITGAGSQSLPDSNIKKIDSLFTKWNNSMSPGCSIGIVKNDSLIYSKGFGMANLEYAIPNTATTIFHMASVSKQFTAWAILLLEKQGKLTLDDDIHKWLPWFPDVKATITIRHLLNHTSGIRDQWQLLAIAGTRLDDVITQEHIVKILSQQQELNFKPGEKYSYSNSGYTMLAEIVKTVSGRTLRQFSDSAVFKPLGMSNTHFHDDYTEIVKNRSYSYDRKNMLQFTNSILSYSNAGATSLFTNVTDMSKWVMNFYRHTTGDQQLVDSLTKKGKLNSGKELTYASGIAVDTYMGWRKYSHSGGDAGYRTYLSVFPDLKMGFMVFSNLGDMNPGYLTDKMAEFFITDSSKKITTQASVITDSSAALLKDSAYMKKFVGDYFGEDGLPVNIKIDKRLLYYDIYGESNILVKQSKDSFAIMVNPDIKFVFDIHGKDTTVDIVTPDQVYRTKKYIKDTTQNDQLLQTYTGEYYSPELDCKYGIVLKDHHLVLTNKKYSDTQLNRINNDHLTSQYWWIDHLQMLRDAKNQVTGFEINSGRIMHLKFIKLPSVKK